MSIELGMVALAIAVPVAAAVTGLLALMSERCQR